MSVPQTITLETSHEEYAAHVKASHDRVSDLWEQVDFHLLEALDAVEKIGWADPFRQVEGCLHQLQQEYRETTNYVKPALPGGRIPFKQKQRRLILERDAYRCVLCGSHKNLHVDHIKPVANGGTNDDANLQTLCRTCNLKKGVRV